MNPAIDHNDRVQLIQMTFEVMDEPEDSQFEQNVEIIKEKSERLTEITIHDSHRGDPYHYEITAVFFFWIDDLTNLDDLVNDFDTKMYNDHNLTVESWLTI